MADGSIAAGSIAGSKTLARTAGFPSRSRADVLGQLSTAGSNEVGFRSTVAASNSPDPTPQQPLVAEPGNGMLSTSSQLLLAETRTQENLSTVADKSTLDKALGRYSESQTSVIETMGLSLLTGGTTTTQTGETSA